MSHLVNGWSLLGGVALIALGLGFVGEVGSPRPTHSSVLLANVGCQERERTRLEIGYELQAGQTGHRCVKVQAADTALISP